MRLGLTALLCFFSVVLQCDCTPPTCYSRALSLSKEIMTLLDKIHSFYRTKACAEVLPVIHIDVHNACITNKLRDFLYVVLNHPSQSCRDKPRMVVLKRKTQKLYSIITRVCYRDLVFFTDDCEAIDTGRSSPNLAEDRLQLLQEDR
ncbi:PREDICTED: cytokine-like protein 1 [Poecilia mexicana]|uniref:Cytokine like 1 n=2 Tax=Poecilia TaxID=8080 RepID=A0A087XL48_POEFO|nr:PREDICTED: cytokine-like protein 1 [Poecilia formosa]XP_014860947.1 PREDICTED: cytokine-like protein 1 [Poecilia mexicana]